MYFDKFFIRFRINKVIKILEEHDGRLTSRALELVRDRKYRNAISALEGAGCIKVTREWGGQIILITTTNKGFSIYCLERHDVWANRIGGFISGVAITVIADLIKNVLL